MNKSTQSNYDRWGKSRKIHNSVEEFLTAKILEQGVHSIYINNQALDLLVSNQASSDTIAIVFSGAIKRTPTTFPPFFSGINLAKNVSCSIVAISDPTLALDEEISIGWYTGNRYLNLQSTLPVVIEKIRLILEAKNIIFCGGSAGGFAALYYASKFSDSTCIAANAQTNILDYAPAAVEKYTKTAFNATPSNLTDLFPQIAFDLKTFKYSDSQKIIYLQNTSDWHTNKHAKPFIENLIGKWTGDSVKEGHVLVHMGNWGTGHIAPPMDLMAQLIQSTVNAHRDERDVIDAAFDLLEAKAKSEEAGNKNAQI